MTENITTILWNFQGFLTSSWKNVEMLKTFIKNEHFGDELLNDFLQSNWETLVEAIICEPGEEFLEVYGDGADCNGASSRVCFPKEVATHRVGCLGKIAKEVDDRLNGGKIVPENCIFHSFVTYSNNEYYQGLPFNGILLEHDKGISVIDINDVNFIKSNILQHI